MKIDKSIFKAVNFNITVCLVEYGILERGFRSSSIFIYLEFL